MSEQYDVIVAGAGPSGSMAAIVCARSGLKVLLIDKETFPRAKPCGDAVPADFMHRLYEAGIVFESADIHAVDQAVAYGPGGARLSVPVKQVAGHSAAIISRETLDTAMRNCAITYGALSRTGSVKSVVMDGDKVVGVSVRLEGQKSDTNFYAKVVIAADGATSVIARALRRDGKTPDHALAIARRGYIHTPGFTLDHTIEFGFLKKMQPGYGWMFPAGKHVANVGVGIRTDHYKKYNHDLDEMLEYYVSTIKSRIGGFTQVQDIATWQLPFYYDAPLQRVFNGALLVGDAGNFIDPVTGAGINTGALTGELAGKVVSQALSLGDVSAQALSLYDHLWRNHECVGQFLQKAAFYHNLFSTFPWLMDAVIRLTRPFPFLVNQVLGKF